jgi:endonuclease YncB( thermonuclease family)
MLVFACVAALAQEADPCEALLGEAQSRPAWACIVLDVPQGDTLLVRVKDIGVRRVKLAGLRAPHGREFLAAVSRFHLAAMAKGLRTFLVMEPPPKPWPDEVTASVEDFSETQLRDGMGQLVESELGILGAYKACQCRQGEAQARKSKAGVWLTPP